MNPDTNRFEQLTEQKVAEPSGADTLGVFHKMVQQTQLIRPNGEPVPQHWTQFHLNEVVTIKNYSFRVAYVGETSILFEPVGIPVIGK